MKKANKIILCFGILALIAFGCTKSFEDTNVSPNSPVDMPTYALMTNVQKQLMDNMRDEWWGGRFGWLLDQQINQNNYTTEDRYLFRQSVNDQYWNTIYTTCTDLQEIIRLNTEEATKGKMSAYGANSNQIAAAMVLRSWVIQNLTDIYGDVPFSKAWDAVNNPSPAYDNQKDIYSQLLKDLTDASAMIQLDKPVFTQGDELYGGDALKWKKFANSLKMRVALRLTTHRGTETFDGKTPIQMINEIIESGVYFESNDDNAVFTYKTGTPNQAPLYDAYFIQARTDFAICNQFVVLLKGENPPASGTGRDNANPFFGLADPRLPILAAPTADPEYGTYFGMPYGMQDAESKLIGLTKASWPSDKLLAPDFGCIYMDYAEVCFMISEAKGYDDGWYKKGIRASMEYWGVDAAAIDSYIAAVPAANPENVATQKYIALFEQAHQPWIEYRRTGFPKTMVLPGEVTFVWPDGHSTIFEADGSLWPLTDLPRRMTYSQKEQTLNADNYAAASARIGGDTFLSKVWWEGGN
ncbi:MAG TPA: SusD/RagB family nutrient-binding outer membrane lipoprotein [Bacteroidales bacterium]|nr:SusD/RagB family nutrient-binding outer membrane lipoprotein [Bacteroidales bacterium]HPT04146.1 SusD/RagB family nutrient-binding outer membrane lipoprotein [Bacteroidales bacterium]